MRHNGDVCLLMVRPVLVCADAVHGHPPGGAGGVGYTGVLFKGE